MSVVFELYDLLAPWPTQSPGSLLYAYCVISGVVAAPAGLSPAPRPAARSVHARTTPRGQPPSSQCLMVVFAELIGRIAAMFSPPVQFVRQRKCNTTQRCIQYLREEPVHYSRWTGEV